MLRERIEGLLASTGLELEMVLVFAGIGIVGMLVLSWLWSLALTIGSRRRRTRGRQLGDELRLVDELQAGVRLPEPEISEDALLAGDGPLEAPPSVDKPDPERRARLEQRVRSLEASQQEVRAAIRHESAWMERRRVALSDRCGIIGKTLENARSDREKGAECKAKAEELRRTHADQISSIATRRLACELLDGAVVRTADRFNDHLRSLMVRNLPRLTDGRYEHLHVGEDLQVRVYSNEKRNFLDLDETSSGTQRQVMLALRLALAQELVAHVARDRQFAFLDEPFAFFDDTRMRGALRMLPELSAGITQYWVVAQRFPRDEFLALEIPCGGHVDSLEVGLPPGEN
jgi:exonuclease SbcC